MSSDDRVAGILRAVASEPWTSPEVGMALSKAEAMILRRPPFDYDTGIDETARDHDAEALADLGDVGDLRWDTDFNTQTHTERHDR